MSVLTVVVPVYNMERYLPRCVESLQNQTLKDIEIILVDDGSPDQCPLLCEEYAKKDKRIRVIHKKNGGLSSARNAGLDAASGKYLAFLDADDSVEPSMYEELLEVIIRENIDFVMADYIRILSDGESYMKSTSIRAGRYDKFALEKEIYPSLIMGKNIEYGPLLSVNHCLYDVDFLKRNNIRFDEQVRWSEDNIFSAIVGYCANSFYYLKGRALYNYYQNPGTITTSYRPGAWQVYCIMNKHLREYFRTCDTYDFSMQFKWHTLYYACVCLGQAFSLSREKRKKAAYEVLYSKELRHAFEELDWSGMPIKLRFQMLMMKYKCYSILKALYMRRINSK